MSQFNFQSSAIENIVEQNGQLVVTFNGGRQYTYNAANLQQFVSTLSETIAAGGSVGRLVNQAIRSEQLVAAAA